MSEKSVYQCKECGKTKTMGSDEASPDCCGGPMSPMPTPDACTSSATAEHSRLDETDEPCDDGRSG